MPPVVARATVRVMADILSGERRRKGGDCTIYQPRQSSVRIRQRVFTDCCSLDHDHARPLLRAAASCSFRCC